MRLFERVGRSISLTDAGRLLQMRCGQLMELVSSIKTEVSRSPEATDVTLAGREFLIGHFGFELMARILKWNPKSRFTIAECSGVEAQEMVASAKADFALTIQPAKPGLRGRAVGEFKLRCCVAPGHPLLKIRKYGGKLSVHDVLRHDFVSPNSPLFIKSGIKQSIDSWRDDKYPRQVKWTVQTVDMLHATVRTQEAVAYVPSFWAESRGLVPLDLADYEYDDVAKVYLVVRRSEVDSWQQSVFRS